MNPLTGPADDLRVRRATPGDVEALLRIERECFATDALNKRSFKRWIRAEHGILLVIECQTELLAYGLLWCHRGTPLARLYSLGVLPTARGRGLAQRLLEELEKAAVENGRLFMRLEVAKHNTAAISLYENSGYRVFGEYFDYYDDHSDALRMQKTIQHANVQAVHRTTPWYRQTTEFTCGPASLMMAMASLDPGLHLDQHLELDIWREATTIFMTSGHGGCHPLGLALAAQRRGYDVCACINSRDPLFIDGVRSQHKKAIMTLVHEQFVHSASLCPGIELRYEDVSQQQIATWLDKGYAVVMLISTYRLDGKKTPHWVTVTNIDDRCLYVHDSAADQLYQRAIDCQHLPIAREDFDRLSTFGTSRLRTAIALRPRSQQILE